MPPKIELTPQFLKLQNKMRETREGEWIFISKKVKNKYSNLIIDQITRTRKDEDFSEYRIIAQDLLLKVMPPTVIEIGFLQYSGGLNKSSMIDVVKN